MTAEQIFNGVILAAGAALAWALWQAARPRAEFRVQVVDGQAQAVEGTVTPAFLERVREVCAAHGVGHGTIAGRAHGRLIRLWFSREIPPNGRQQLRNWWATFGWSAPRRDCESKRRA